MLAGVVGQGRQILLAEALEGQRRMPAGLFFCKKINRSLSRSQCAEQGLDVFGIQAGRPGFADQGLGFGGIQGLIAVGVEGLFEFTRVDFLILIVVQP